MFSRRGILCGLLSLFVKHPADRQVKQAPSLGVSLEEYRALLQAKLSTSTGARPVWTAEQMQQVHSAIVSQHLYGHRASVRRLYLTMPKDTVLISGRRLCQLPDAEILHLVKTHSVAVIHADKGA